MVATVHIHILELHRGLDRAPVNMAALPAQLLLLLCGNLAPLPKRRPMMSARPSPPHMSATTCISVSHGMAHINIMHMKLVADAQLITCNVPAVSRPSPGNRRATRASTPA